MRARSTVDTHKTATRVKRVAMMLLMVIKTRLMAKSRTVTINCKGRPPTKGARAAATAYGKRNLVSDNMVRVGQRRLR